MMIRYSPACVTSASNYPRTLDQFPQAFQFTASSTSNDIVALGHPWKNGDAVSVSIAGGDLGLPSPLSVSQYYYVRDLNGNAFRLAYTPGGPVIDITTPGIGLMSGVLQDSFAAQLFDRLMPRPGYVAFDIRITQFQAGQKIAHDYYELRGQTLCYGSNTKQLRSYQEIYALGDVPWPAWRGTWDNETWSLSPTYQSRGATTKQVFVAIPPGEGGGLFLRPDWYAQDATRSGFSFLLGEVDTFGAPKPGLQVMNDWAIALTGQIIVNDPVQRHGRSGSFEYLNTFTNQLTQVEIRQDAVQWIIPP